MTQEMLYAVGVQRMWRLVRVVERQLSFQTPDESKNFFEKSSVKCKMRPSARRRQTQRKHKKYLDDVIVHLHARNTPLQGIDFF